MSIIQARQLAKEMTARGMKEEEENDDEEGEEGGESYGSGGRSSARGVGKKHLKWEECWALDTQVLQLFNTKRGLHGNEPNNYYKELRKSALNGQFIRIGRQDSDTGVIHDVTEGGDAATLLSLKPQQYLLLTPAGRAQLSGQEVSSVK